MYQHYIWVSYGFLPRNPVAAITMCIFVTMRLLGEIGGSQGYGINKPTGCELRDHYTDTDLVINLFRGVNWCNCWVRSNLRTYIWLRPLCGYPRYVRCTYAPFLFSTTHFPFLLPQLRFPLLSFPLLSSPFLSSFLLYSLPYSFYLISSSQISFPPLIFPSNVIPDLTLKLGNSNPIVGVLEE